MEVHHHSHTSRKEWTHYFWEFLMLFLAVTLGFFVENQREHYVEHKRAKELAISLYEELKSDTVNLKAVTENRIHKEANLLWLADYFRDSSLSNLPREFYPSLTFGLFSSTYVYFEPKDGILQQLKNSGSLRYFQDVEIQKAIGNYSVALNNIRNRIERESLLTIEPNRIFLTKHFDHSWLTKVTEDQQASSTEVVNKYLSSNRFVPASLKKSDKIDREETENYLRYFCSILSYTRIVQIARYLDAVKKLIELLKEEYDLE